MALGVSTVGIFLLVWGVLLALLVVWLWRRGGLPSAEAETEVAVARMERRAGRDRRGIDIGPPDGMPDRRHGFDRRRGTLSPG
jgi:hypothetical protein